MMRYVTRRFFMGACLALLACSRVSAGNRTGKAGLVERDGWILARSDLG
ncbi:hypothetical protein ACLB6G_00015 [Zhengella sp. ZM62]